VRRFPQVAFGIAIGTFAALAIVAWRGPVYDLETMRRFDEVTARLHELPRDVPLVVIAPQLPHWSILEGTPPPKDNTLETLQSIVDRGDAVRTLIADQAAQAYVARLIENGDARLVWTLPHTRTALLRGFPAPIRLVEVKRRG
jgi:hypothetical protein